ncbi:MAG TPA: hypothetical protein VFI28_06745 [Candidatus Limnocylindrales bacterium]|nr:hypothetical protein [Candidatus Limnocylindrales bacterium]
MGRRHRESRGRHSSGTPRATARPVTPRPAYERHSPTGSLADPTPADPRRDGDTAGKGDLIPVAPAEEMRRAVAAPMPNAANAADVASMGSVASVGSVASMGSVGSVARSGATTAQLRRFIKSRPYVPLHELRRRFVLNGYDDDVVPFDIDGRCVWVGLPPDEGRMLADLVRQGEVGCELSLDPDSPVVVGVFPIRPMVISRPGRPPSAAADGA